MLWKGGSTRRKGGFSSYKWEAQAHGLHLPLRNDASYLYHVKYALYGMILLAGMSQYPESRLYSFVCVRVLFYISLTSITIVLSIPHSAAEADRILSLFSVYCTPALQALAQNLMVSFYKPLFPESYIFLFSVLHSCFWKVHSAGASWKRAHERQFFWKPALSKNTFVLSSYATIIWLGQNLKTFFFSEFLGIPANLPAPDATAEMWMPSYFHSSVCIFLPFSYNSC